MIPYEILIRGNTDGTLSGCHVIDKVGGDARPITAEDLNSLAPDIDSAALTTRESVASELAEAQSGYTSLKNLYDTMVEQVTSVLRLAGTEEFVAAATALGVGFLTPEVEKERAATIAEIAALQAKLAALPTP